MPSGVPSVNSKMACSNVGGAWRRRHAYVRRKSYLVLSDCRSKRGHRDGMMTSGNGGGHQTLAASRMRKCGTVSIYMSLGSAFPEKSDPTDGAAVARNPRMALAQCAMNEMYGNCRAHEATKICQYIRRVYNRSSSGGGATSVDTTEIGVGIVRAGRWHGKGMP